MTATSLVRPLLLLSLLTSGMAWAQKCPKGQSRSEDTAGQCCWPGQAWSKVRKVCVGVPECPSGFEANGESCQPAGCPAGQLVTEDTAGRCCWPGQAWSNGRSACVGVPQCPPAFVAQGEACVAAQGAAALPPPPVPPGAPTGGPAPFAPPPPPPPFGAPMEGAAAPERAPGEVLVKFEPVDPGNFYTVVAKTSGGRKECRLPCALYLQPGDVTLEVSGGAEFEAEVEIPRDSSMARISHPNKLGAILGRAAVITLGGILAIGTVLDLSRNQFRPLLPVAASLAIGVGVTVLIIGVVRKPSVELTAMPGLEQMGQRDRPSLKLTGISIGPSERGGLALGAAFSF
jgi:hypothetical protein